MYCIRCKRISSITTLVDNNISEDWLLVIKGDDIVYCENHTITYDVPEGTLFIRPAGSYVRHSIGLCPNCQLTPKQIENNRVDPI